MNIFNKIKGYRTIAAGWLTALVPAAAMVGIEYDPDQIINFIKEFNIQIAIVFTMAGGAINYFRTLANKD